MKFTVVWKPRAERQLAEIWSSASDRAAITWAADRMDAELELNLKRRANHAKTLNLEFSFSCLWHSPFEFTRTTEK